MSIVFDGHPLDHFPDGSRFRGVSVFFAHRGGSADDRILELVRSNNNRHNLTVVTSDRALALRVESEGVKTVRSGELRHKLDSLGIEAPQTLEVLPDEMSGWLRYFGVDAEDEPDSAD